MSNSLRSPDHYFLEASAFASYTCLASGNQGFSRFHPVMSITYQDLTTSCLTNSIISTVFRQPLIRARAGVLTPSLPTKTIPTEIPWLIISGKFPVEMRIPPLEIKNMLESNPLKSRILVWRLAVRGGWRGLWWGGVLVEGRILVYGFYYIGRTLLAEGWCPRKRRRASWCLQVQVTLQATWRIRSLLLILLLSLHMIWSILLSLLCLLVVVVVVVAGSSSSSSRK